MIEDYTNICRELITGHSIIAVIVLDTLDSALPTVEAILKGGVKSIELTLRTAIAVDAIEAIKKNLPEMTIGAGTVLFPDQVDRVLNAGADFAVAPGLSPITAGRAIELGLPFAPGVATPSDIENAFALGFRTLKYYPAEAMGGISYLSAMAGPYNHLKPSFIPLGGLNLGNVASYLESPIVGAVGGSWIASRNLINDRDWKQIEANAAEVSRLAEQIRP